MENDMVSVTLAGPVKVDGRRHKAGRTITVSRGVARDLAARDLLVAGPPFDAGDVQLTSDFDQAVELAVAKALADREAVVEENLALLVAAHAEELKAMKARAEAAETKAVALESELAVTADRAKTAEEALGTLKAASIENTKPAPKSGGKKP